MRFFHFLQSNQNVLCRFSATRPENFPQTSKNRHGAFFLPRFLTLYASTCVHLIWTWLVCHVGESNLSNNPAASLLLGSSQASTRHIRTPGSCIRLRLRHDSGTSGPADPPLLFIAGNKMEKAHWTHFDWGWNVQTSFAILFFTIQLFLCALLPNWAEL